MTGRWELLTASGQPLGTFPGATPAEAIRAMYETHPAFALVEWLSSELDALVKLWGGRATCRGSERAMPAVTVPEVVVPSLSGFDVEIFVADDDACPDTERRP